jgi:hypothetical protein
MASQWALNHRESHAMFQEIDYLTLCTIEYSCTAVVVSSISHDLGAGSLHMVCILHGDYTNGLPL